MRLNVHGQACHGLVALSIDGQPVVPAVRSTAPDWLTETSMICQVEEPRESDHWVLKAYDLTRRSWRLVDPDPASTVSASGTGVWAAWRLAGVRSNLHPSQPGAGLWGVGHDGALGYCRAQARGTGIVFRSTAGTVSEVLSGVALHDVHIPGYGLAAAVTHGRLRTIGAPAAVTVDEEIFGPRLVQLRRSAVWWVLYHTPTRLLLQPVTDPVGYVVHDQPTTFGADVVELPSGLLRVVWSSTAGEGPTAFQMRDVDLGAARVELGEVAPPLPERPRVTMTYAPTGGPVPLTVTAVRILSGGPATRLLWRQRRVGETTWTQVAENPATDPDHHYRFTTAGAYELGVDVIGPGGSDSTRRPRLVEVTG